MNSQAREAFVQLLTGEQLNLQYYITRLLRDPHAAQQVLQETNVVLWRKAGEFEPGTNFTAWTRKIAYWQVQSYVRDRKRDRHVFSEELIEQLASHDSMDNRDDEAFVALRHCLQSVSPGNLDILRARYEDSLPIAAIAQRVGKTRDAVKVGLMRLRRSLLHCIQRQLADHQ